MSKKLLIPLALGLALVLVVAGAVFAQNSTPGANATPVPGTTTPGTTAPGLGKGFGPFGMFRGGQNNWTGFDALAKALNLTPTQLFDQLHSGKTLADIAKAQGVDLTAVQNAMKTAQQDAFKAAIAQAVKDGKITQAQADWLQQGLSNGWLGKGGFGFGMGRGFKGGAGMMGGRGMRGGRFNAPGQNQQNQPKTSPTPQA